MFFKRPENQIAVSVLTPVYNVARYLPECLESLKRQTLKNIEFICINDGSTDNSLEILKRYACDDSRFVVIDKPNSGYGATMNCGLRAARGEYIGIVESDDVASPAMFKTLYKFASKHNCDLVKSNYYEYDGQCDVLMEPFRNFAYKQVFDPKDMPDVVRELPIIWAGLYRRSMVMDNEIFFAETPGASFQDTSFVFRCWVASSRAALLPDPFLHYRVNRGGSSVNSSSKVFAVCDEYAVNGAFLEASPARTKAYGKLLNAMRMGTYRWNYNRIAPEYRAAFCQRWAQEYQREMEKGLMDPALFAPSDWGLVQELLADPAAFAAKYDELLWPDQA